MRGAPRGARSRPSPSPKPGPSLLLRRSPARTRASRPCTCCRHRRCRWRRIRRTYTKNQMEPSYSKIKNSIRIRRRYEKKQMEPSYSSQIFLFGAFIHGLVCQYYLYIFMVNISSNNKVRTIPQDAVLPLGITPVGNKIVPGQVWK